MARRKTKGRSKRKKRFSVTLRRGVTRNGSSVCLNILRTNVKVIGSIFFLEPHLTFPPRYLRMGGVSREGTLGPFSAAHDDPGSVQPVRFWFDGWRRGWTENRTVECPSGPPKTFEAIVRFHEIGRDRIVNHQPQAHRALAHHNFTAVGSLRARLMRTP